MSKINSESRKVSQVVRQVAGVCAASSLVFASACGTDSGTSGDPSVLFAVQGTRPSSDALSVTASRAFGALSAFSNSERSVLDTTDTQVEVSVLGIGGSEIGVLTLTDARVVLKEIKLKTLEERESEDEAESESESLSRRGLSGSDDSGDSSDGTEDSSGDEIEFEGPYVVDLVRNESSPSFDTIEIPAGDYREVELKLHKVDGSEKDDDGVQAVGDTDALYDNSVVLSGTYTPTGGSSVTFSFTYDLSEKFELSGATASEGFSVEVGVDNPIIVAFRMAKWFDFTGQSKDLSNLVGNISLDESASGDSSAVREAIRDNLKESADYGKDKDGDGRLGSDEDDDSDESGEDAHDD